MLEWPLRRELTHEKERTWQESIYSEGVAIPKAGQGRATKQPLTHSQGLNCARKRFASTSIVHAAYETENSQGETDFKFGVTARLASNRAWAYVQS